MPPGLIYGAAGEGFLEYARVSGRVAVLAVHGGGIEPGCEELALFAAERTGCSLYVFSGRRERDNSGLRAKSRSLFQEPGSLRARVVARASVIISLHGHGGESRSVYAGGGNTSLKRLFAGLMAERLPAYPVVTDPREIPEGLAGLHPDNVVNLPEEGGVQLELPRSLRECTDAGFGERGPVGDAFKLGEVLVGLITGYRGP